MRHGWTMDYHISVLNYLIWNGLTKRITKNFDFDIILYINILYLWNIISKYMISIKYYKLT